MSKKKHPNPALVPTNPDQLPSTQIGSDDQFVGLAKSADCIGSLQLFTKGKAINRKMVGRGHYGIPISDEEVDDLGDHIDIIPLARRPKTIDMTDSEAIIVNYDPDTAEFKRMAAMSLEKESLCMYGPSFLVYERSRNLFLEFFCGNKLSRSEAKNIYPYLPLTQTDIDARKARGDDVGDLKPHGPLPLTLKSLLVGKGMNSWHVPVVVKCEEAFTTLPPMERIVKELASFLTIRDKYPQITEATEKTVSRDLGDLAAIGVVERIALPGGGVRYVFAHKRDKKGTKETSTDTVTSPGKRLTKGSKGSSRCREGGAEK